MNVKKITLGPGFAATDFSIRDRIRRYIGQWSITVILENDTYYYIDCNVEGQTGTITQSATERSWWTNRSYILSFSDGVTPLDLHKNHELAEGLKSVIEEVADGKIQVESHNGLSTSDQGTIKEVFDNLLVRWDLVIKHSEMGVAEGRIIETNFGEDRPKVPRA